MNKKIFYTILLGLIILAALGWLIYVYVYPQYQFWQFKQSYDKMMQVYTDMLKNDTYGGQTPEETYNLYIAALQRGDTEAASKYFYWEKQVAQKEKLDELKAKGELAKYITDLPKWSELKEEAYGDSSVKKYSHEVFSEKAETVYDPLLQKEVTFPAGKYKAWIDFQLNKSANIWKIYSL